MLSNARWLDGASRVLFSVLSITVQRSLVLIFGIAKSSQSKSLWAAFLLRFPMRSHG